MPPKKVPITHARIVARFAGALRSRRLELGLTQAQLAGRADLSPNYLTRLEGGTVAPGIDLLERIAAALETTAAELLPAVDVPDEGVALKKEAARLFKGLVEAGDTDTLRVVVGLLSRISTEPVCRR